MDPNSIKAALEFGQRAAGIDSPLFREGKDPVKWNSIRNDPFYENMLQEVKNEGERLLQVQIKALPFSLYKIYDESGSRIEYERAYFEHRLRLNTFTILTIVYGEQKYIAALEDTIWALCDEYTWSLPAHLGGKSLQIIEPVQRQADFSGGVMEVDREHRHVVDLFAAEVGFALCEVVGLLEEQLSDIIVYRAKKEVTERILKPYCELKASFWWESCTNNWAAVCAGSVGAAALYLIKDTRILTPLLQRILGTMECYLSGFENDGACTEGLSYWSYGFGYFSFFAELLKQRTAGKVDLFQGDKVERIALFQQKCFMTENHVISFSDSSIKSTFPLGLTHRLKDLFPTLEVPELQFAARYPFDHCYRWAHAIRNFVWSNPTIESKIQEESAYYLEDSQWFFSRALQGPQSVCFAAKGGHNNEPHNHNDVGNFVLHVNGETLVVDTGAGEYTKQYFGKERYSFLCNSSLGHSVPVVEGYSQSTGHKFAARILDHQNSPEQDLFSLDLAKAYANPNLQSLVRSFTFEKTGTLVLRLKDQYTFTAKPSSIEERFISFHAPKLLEPGRIRIQGAHYVDVIYNADQMECIIERADFANHQAIMQDLYIVRLLVKEPTADEHVSVSFEGLQ